MGDATTNHGLGVDRRESIGDVRDEFRAGRFGLLVKVVGPETVADPVGLLRRLSAAV